MNRALVIALLLCASTFALSQSAIQRPNCDGDNVLSGVLVDAAGKPVSGVRVTAWPIGVDLGAILPNMETGPNGEFRFEHVCDGKYTVVVDDAHVGYDGNSLWLNQFLYGEATPTVKLGRRHRTGELRLILPPKPGTLRLSVFSSAGSELRDYMVEVTVRGSRKRSVTWHLTPDLEERYRVIPLPPNTAVLVSVSATGHSPWTAGTTGEGTIEVATGGSINLKAQLPPLR